MCSAEKEASCEINSGVRVALSVEASAPLSNASTSGGSDASTAERSDGTAEEDDDESDD